MFFSRLAVVTLLAGVSLARECSRSYVVKDGDYCDAISAANDVSTYQLAALNPEINAGCLNLKPGQTLCLAEAAQEDCQDVYVVKSADTCSGIAQSHATNSTILALNNPQINEDCSNIYIGEVLCVGTSVKAPAGSGVVIAPTPGKSENTPPANSKPVKQPAKNVAPPPAQAPPAPAPSAPAPPAPAPPAPSPAPEVVGDDDDEELPYCDEIDE